MNLKSDLVDPAEAPGVPGLHVPHQFYWVLDSPAPLAGMEFPESRATYWQDLHSKGFRWIVCLASECPRYDPAPLQPLASVDLTDLHDEPLPQDPETEEKAIRAIAYLSREKLRAGEGVIVHCVGGTGRTGTVLGVILRMLHFEDAEVLNFLNRVHRMRGRNGWPEALWQEEVVRRIKPKKPGLA